MKILVQLAILKSNFRFIPDTLKSNFGDSLHHYLVKKFQTTLILAFEANSAKIETKIVKITHSAKVVRAIVANLPY